MLLPNGVVAEVQMWWPSMYEAKAGRGQKLYTEARNTPDGPAKQALMDEARQLYQAAAADAEPFLGSAGRSPYLLRNADADISVAESSSSKGSIGTQPRLGDQTNAVSPTSPGPSVTTGRRSISQNRTGTSSERPTILEHSFTGRPAEPDWTAETSAYLAAEKDAAGLDAAGDFPERAQFEAMKEAGALTKEELDAYEAAQAEVKRLDKSAETYDAAANCIIRGMT